MRYTFHGLMAAGKHIAVDRLTNYTVQTTETHPGRFWTVVWDGSNEVDERVTSNVREALQTHDQMVNAYRDAPPRPMKDYGDGEDD